MKRKLGSTGLEIAPLVFGGNVFGWTIDAKDSFALLDHFIAEGGTMVDTADAYSRWVDGHVGGESESIIGHWLKLRGRRDDVQVATKVGAPMPDGQGLSAAWITSSIDGSLRRLQTDYIDLYYAHTDDVAVPQDEVLFAFDQLMKAGKIRAIGASNFGAPRLAASLDISETLNIARYGALQPRFNLLERDKFSTELQQLCVNRDVGVLTYYSLAMGFLTGAYGRDSSLDNNPRPRLKEYRTERAFRVLDVLTGVAAELNASPAQVALAWLAAQPGITAPIASATTLDQLNELLGSMDLILPPAALTALDSASAQPYVCTSD